MSSFNSGHPGLAESFPPLTSHEAIVEANRCIYCYDAPCTHACPTHIDIPRFIKKIATGNLTGSARTILESNLLGATCARVCPVQELCEGACVLRAEHKPIQIGRLQRYAMDSAAGKMPRNGAAPRTGRRVAVIGAGPAGLSCAGELALRGHSVTVFEKRELGGGLSTYGIIALREPIRVALEEVEMIRGLGVEVRYGAELGVSLSIDDLRANFDAVFLAVGLGATPPLVIEGEEHIIDGLEWIEQSKLDPAAMRIGRSVAVIGAGNTAIDCATIARRLGAERVVIVYRRTAEEMTAYLHEYEFARAEGIEFRFLTQPVRVCAEEGRVVALECAGMRLGAPDATGRPSPERVEGSEFRLEVDQVVKAIGQTKPAVAELLGLRTHSGKIEVNEAFETNVRGIFAGGDCIRAKGAASTVMGVQDGKLAAAVIHERLAAKQVEGAQHG